MNKTSQFFLYLLLAISAIGLYNSTIDANPVSAGTRFFALSGFFLITVSIAIGPLAIISPREFAHMIEPRRAVGIASFAFVFCHFFLTFSRQLGMDFSLVLSSLPLQIGFAGYLLLLPLALTSSDWATKKMGAVFWKNFQRLSYLAFALSLAHFVLMSNGLSLKSPNFAEFALVAFAIGTIVLQLVGFFIVRKRKAEAKRKEEELKKSQANSVQENPKAVIEPGNAPQKSP